MVATGYSQGVRADNFETLAPIAFATFNRLDWDLRQLDVDHAFIQSRLDTDIYLCLPPCCGSVSTA